MILTFLLSYRIIMSRTLNIAICEDDGGGPNDLMGFEKNINWVRN